MPSDLTSFDLAETLRTGRDIRRVCADARTLEEAAQRMCRSLYENLSEGGGSRRACVLVRCYKTHSFGDLPAALQSFVRTSSTSAGEVQDNTKCLVLLGTAGDEPAWNSRFTSRHHQAIALSSVRAIEQAPMIARLFADLGVELEQLVQPARVALQTVRAKTYGVFFVEDARDNPSIPAQDFVERWGVKSVIGCGGELPRDDMFASILFSRAGTNRSVAQRFRTLALDMKASFFRFGTDEVFN